MPSNDLPIRGTFTHKVPKVDTSVSAAVPTSTEVSTLVSTSNSAGDDDNTYTNQVRETMSKVEKDPVDVLFENASEALTKKVEPKPLPTDDLARLLPIQDMNLIGNDEVQNVSIFLEARTILGPSSAIALVCATDCPFRHKCPLYAIDKAPFGTLCPFEASYVTDRFSAWMRDFAVTEATMTETERVIISSLVVLDIQELRLLSILSQSSRANMTTLVVRDSDIETHMPIAYETVVAPETQLRRDIHEQRIRILNDYNLTPAAKAKAMKAMMLRRGGDMASRQSANADLIRQASRTTVDAVVVDSKG